VRSGLARHAGLEQLLANVLCYGTWIGSTVVAVGLAMGPIHWLGSPFATSAQIVTAGIALFIFLPVLRVLLMLIVFIRLRDYQFGMIATLVLAIIVLGAALGMHMAGAMPG
jgi:hypothetical protein